MNKVKRQITVSLSTTPKRIGNLMPTLKSILNQTVSPDNIILCVPEYCSRLGQYFGSIPDYLHELEKTTQFKILRVEDYGPATKFLPTWRYINWKYTGNRENHFLIWLDDDIEYANTLIEELVENCSEGIAIAATGFNLLPNHHKMVLRHLQSVDILEGWGGVCCRLTDIPNLNEFWTVKPYESMTFIEKCHWHSDDYVMSRALQSNGIKTVVCCTEKFNRFKNKPLEYGLKEDALQNSTETSGHHVAYAALERKRSFDRLLRELKGTSL